MSWHEYAIELVNCFKVNGTPLFTADHLEADYQNCFSNAVNELVEYGEISSEDRDSLIKDYSFDGKSWQELQEEYTGLVFGELETEIKKMRKAQKEKNDLYYNAHMFHGGEEE